MLLGAAALVVLPAAIAWACVPASSIGFDKPGYKYKAGETVTVTGRGFSSNAPVAMKLQAPGATTGTTVGNATTKTDGTGGFSDSFALASDAAPGDYVVSVTVGTGGARETLTVEPPAGPGPVVPPIVTPTPTPPVITPSTPPNTSNTAALRRKGIAKCNRKFRTRKAKGAAKKKTARRRAACIRRVRKLYP